VIISLENRIDFFNLFYQALASTVGRDYTAPHYKFHDDPYLIPYSNMNKRSYALSKEAGRKAAKWIREQHADLFQHAEAEPPIEVRMVFIR
jgi:pentatricopeptide repeat domain-containing protein 3